MMKTCTKCGVEHPLDNFYFRKEYNKYRNECKPCFKAAVALRSTGWTQEETEAAWERQKGKCAACGGPMAPEGVGDSSMVRDHCHGSEKPRELLHSACNKALGLMQDNPEAIDGLLAYALKWQERK